MKEQIQIRYPFGIPIAALKTIEFCALMITWGKSKSKTRIVTYLNAHCINIFFNDPEYARIVGSADLVYADGQSVVWASRLLKQPIPERISAGDFIHTFCGNCRDNSLSLYLLGSHDNVAELAAAALQKENPGLKIAGTHHGFLNNDNIQETISEIKRASPDILLIGMGAPLQEKFADQYLKKINVPVIWCVGALFEYYAKAAPRAPFWMRRFGLEWLFRLATNPSRFWRRYLFGNLTFMLRTLKYFFKNMQK